MMLRLHENSSLNSIAGLVERALLGALLLIVAMPAAASPADEIGAAFVEMIRRDDPRAAIPGIAGVVGRYDCIQVDVYEAKLVSETAEATSVEVRLHGAGAPMSRRLHLVPLPISWHVQAHREGGQWVLDHASSGEQRVAKAMFEASPDEAERILATADDVILRSVLQLYADTAQEAANLERGEHALRLTRSWQIRKAEVSALTLLSLQHAIGGRAEAVPIADEAIEVAREHGDVDDEVQALFNRGVVALFRGEAPDAKRNFLAAADLVDRADEGLTSMKALQMYIHVNTKQGELLEALRASNRLATTAAELRWDEGRMASMINLAIVQRGLGNIEGALWSMRKVLRLAQETGNKLITFMAYNNIANYETDLGNLAAAKSALSSAMASDPDNPQVKLSGQSFLAYIALEEKRYGDAESALKRAHDVLDRHKAAFIAAGFERAKILAGEAQLAFLQGRFDAVVRSAREAIDAASERVPGQERSAHEAFVYRWLGRAQRALGNDQEAIDALRAAIAASEEVAGALEDPMARGASLAGLVSPYAELVDLLAEKKDALGALRVAEQMKGRALLDTLAAGHVDLSVSMSATERAREQELEAQVVEHNKLLVEARTAGKDTADLERQLATSRIALDAFGSEMRLRYPALNRRRRDENADPVLPLDANTAVVEYVVAERAVVAFVLTRNEKGEMVVHAERIPIDREQLVADVDALVRRVAGRSSGYAADARKLHQQLFEVVEKLVPADRELCIIPDHVLWKVPFHALVRSDGKFVAEHHSIFYAQSLALLRKAMEERSVEPANLLAFGNPATGATPATTLTATMRGVDLGALPHAEEEVRALEGLYTRRRTFYRGDARESVFKSEAGRHSILHLAAHAIVDDRAPMYSAIVLAVAPNEPSEDGLLEAREVIDLELDADLAVLSACETGRGKLTAGEGVVGLAWAFFAAGCPTTVVSQWNAESRATSLLMVELHRRLVAGDSVARALRAAQQTVRRDPRYKHPFYWAPFIAMGAAARGIR